MLGILAILALGAASELRAEERYSERYRPQFHFTPERNWMNDPNGMFYHDGEYHLFYQYNPFGDRWGHMSWGHAVSPDMAHWTHLPVALHEKDGVMIFSGSAVVDHDNTSGFGRDGQPPLVAIYTGHYTTQPLQNQHIAYSTDRGRTWTKYPKNPVLDIGKKDFRDPKVFWHDESHQWIMVVALSIDRIIQFYGSPNLKDWELLSEFGPAGAVKGIWECPDLFPLPVDGNSKDRRWVLEVDLGSDSVAGGSGGQYFVGHFDGRQFILDEASMPTAESVASETQGTAIADFESDGYGAWQAFGSAFGDGPAGGKLGDQQPVSGFLGRGLVNSFAGGDATTGTLHSPAFTIRSDYINFKVGGGAHAGKTCVNLRIGDETVHSTTGTNSETLAWTHWDVRDFKGKRAGIEIVDAHTGGWGHILADHFMFSNRPAHPEREPALWVDYGKDFYAAVSWSDVPDYDGRRLWLGWLSNWQYAQDVPTHPWRSAQSIARELTLRTTPQGFRLRQTPVPELNSLRQSLTHVGPTEVTPGVDPLSKINVGGELLEIIALIRPGTAQEVGFQVRKGRNEQTTVGYDADSRELFVDRTQSGETGFHAQFPGRHAAPMDTTDGVMTLHLFIDTSSVEVFGNDGEAVITDLIFPSPESRGLEFYSKGGSAEMLDLDVWTLKSAWR